MKDSKFMRGQIWWMEGYEVHKEGGKRRPALIVSSDIINSNMMNENITVVPLTTNTERAAMRTNIVISRYNRATSVAKCAELVTIYKNQLVSYESTVDKEVMESVEQAIRFALGMEETPRENNELITSFVKDAQEIKTSIEPKTPVVATFDELKEEKFDDPYLSTLTAESKEYIELMQTEVKRNGNRIIWDAENEALFMKIYTQCGIDEAAKKFDVARSTAPTIAFRLRKKYPDFEKLKSGKAAASYAK